jgi:hypothetical protein
MVYLKVEDDSVKLWRGLFEDGRQLLVGEAGQIPLHGFLNNLHSLRNLRNFQYYERYLRELNAVISFCA